jgi:hypothetical protein
MIINIKTRINFFMYPTPVQLSTSLQVYPEETKGTLVLPVLYSATHPGFLKNSVSQIRPAQAGKLTHFQISKSSHS